MRYNTFAIMKMGNRDIVVCGAGIAYGRKIMHFDTTTKTWSIGHSMPIRLFASEAETIDNRYGLVFSGMTDQRSDSVVMLYDHQTRMCSIIYSLGFKSGFNTCAR